MFRTKNAPRLRRSTVFAQNFGVSILTLTFIYKEIIMFNFESLLKAVDNPIMKGVLAAGGTTALIAATTAFAPIGVVGAAGWTLVYWVFGGTVSYDLAHKMWKNYNKMSKENRELFDSELDKLKRMLDEEAITKEEFNTKANSLYEKYAG